VGVLLSPEGSSQISGSGGGFGKHQPNFRIPAFELVEAEDQRVIFLGLFNVVRMTLVGPMRTTVCVCVFPPREAPVQ
jgi:hypothetical protein